MFWIGLAVACHLAGKFENAVEILSAFEKNFKSEIKVDFDTSEMFLYKNMIIEESGNIQAAYDNLDVIRPFVIDTTTWMESKGEYLLILAKFSLYLNKNAAAQFYYYELFTLNVDSIEYLKGLEKSKDVYGHFNLF